MIIFKRFVYYFGGVLLGIMLLYFFVGGSGASCEYNYLPNARVLKNIQTKKRVYTQHALNKLKEFYLDTSAVSNVLKQGNVNFSKSDTKNDKCNIYVIQGIVSESSKESLEIIVENCFEKATIQDIKKHLD